MSDFNGAVAFLDPATRRRLALHTPTAGTLGGPLASAPDGSRLAAAGFDSEGGFIELFDPRTRRHVAQLHFDISAAGGDHGLHARLRGAPRAGRRPGDRQSSSGSWTHGRDAWPPARTARRTVSTAGSRCRATRGCSASPDRGWSPTAFGPAPRSFATPPRFGPSDVSPSPPRSPSSTRRSAWSPSGVVTARCGCSTSAPVACERPRAVTTRR